jgi:excinuclease ABC subunit C
VPAQSPSGRKAQRALPAAPDRPSDALKAKLRALPDAAGVYLFRDSDTRVIYVGKAQSLRHRVRSYFAADSGGRLARTHELVSRIHDLEMFRTDTTQEALLLECTLIKRYRPRYNVRLKDDKFYLYIKVSVQEAWPRVYTVRSIQRDGARYYGPFTNAGAVRQTIKFLQTLFPFRTCRLEIDGKLQRACLLYYIKRCVAPCIGAVSQEDYRAVVGQTLDFLEGRADQVLGGLRREMAAAADELAFERAARLRDRLRSVESIVERQKIMSGHPDDIDALGLAVEGPEACVELFFIRRGKLVGKEPFVLEGTKDVPTAELVRSYLLQYYDSAASIPRRILIPEVVEDAQELQSWLAQKRGGPVELTVPQRGSRRALLAMVAEDARSTLNQQKAAWAADHARSEAMLRELQAQLDLPDMPARIECYDISNLQGTSPVGSMVVFKDGQPKRDHYRKFHIRGVSGSNDFAMLQEMLRRRFLRLGEDDAPEQPVDTRDSKAVAEAMEEAVAEAGVEDRAKGPRRAAAERRRQSGFEEVPDLVIIDGGKGQLAAALAVLRELELEGRFSIVGLAKEHEEVFRPGVSEPLTLPRQSPALHLVQRIRDEAHRYGVTFHRTVRGGRATRSLLDEVPGIGPKRKKALLRSFGSVTAVRRASREQLMGVPGMTRESVERLQEHLALDGASDPAQSGAPLAEPVGSGSR